MAHSAQAAVTSRDQPSQPGDKAYFRPFCCGHTGHFGQPLNWSIGHQSIRVCQTWSGHPGCPTLLTLFTQQHKLRVQSQTGAVPPECRPQTVVIMPEISTRDNENQGETRRGRGAPFIVLSQAGQLPPKYDDLNTHCAAAATSAGPGVKCAFETFLA